MKDFSWKYFCSTGQIDAYLLYKDFEMLGNEKSAEAVGNPNSDYIN